MPPSGRTHADLHAQRTKLANSYNELLDEFSSKDLRSVGNYHLGRLIGKGSFGKVYLASHKLTNGSKVVLKSADKNDANLAREIHHHRQFLHPHIARLYEVIVTETLVWLVLEWCPGDELYNKLLETGAMEPQRVQRIFTQLAGAVSYVHSKSCVHRDLKLENILLDKHGNVKLVDFGFTREYEGKASYLQTWCGTVCYSAPEMLKGEKYAGEKVDVWSLGIILYALLCGELPFDDDDENTTKTRILKEEPKFPETMPQQAKELINAMLSKRPLLRPTLSDILTNPWLSDHAPQQQAILKLQQPPPFSTDLEKETLQRMRSAGVNIDMVIENVLAQRCDSLAGWWALLMEKEERKAKRRERKRKEREAEAKSLRRLSGASGRLEKIAPTIKEAPEEGPSPRHARDSSGSSQRGRNMKRLSGTSAIPDLPRLPEIQTSPTLTTPPLPVDKDSVRSVSSSRQRPAPPPKENRRSRNSMLQVVQANPDFLAPNGFPPKRRRRYQQPILNQLASLKHWFKENAKRARSPHHKATKASPAKTVQRRQTPDGIRRSSTINTSARNSTVIARPAVHHTHSASGGRSRVSTTGSTGSGRMPRPSLSPSPLTPHSSYRRSSTGLRGRKSTSSSVSSIRSIHHHHSHSKASSTSSASLASPALPKPTRSPHASVKVLPATPSGSVFPSGVRVVRGVSPNPGTGAGAGTGAPPAGTGKNPAGLSLGPSAFPRPVAGNTSAAESNAAFSTLPPPSPGLIFARRKRSPFKGPTMLNMSSSPNRHRGSGSEGVSRSGSTKGRASGEVTIQEEDEDEDTASLGAGRISLGGGRTSLDQRSIGGRGSIDGRRSLGRVSFDTIRRVEMATAGEEEEEEEEEEEVEEVDHFAAPGPGEEVVEVASPPPSAVSPNGVDGKDMFAKERDGEKESEKPPVIEKEATQTATTA